MGLGWKQYVAIYWPLLVYVSLVLVVGIVSGLYAAGYRTGVASAMRELTVRRARDLLA